MDSHYVPQFLLAVWARESSDAKVEAFRFDLPKLVSRRYRPRSVGFEPNLYSLSHPKIAGMQQHAVETQFLKRIDSDAARVMQKLTADRLSTLAEVDRYKWARFLCSLRIRQPAIVKKLRTEASDILRRRLASENHRLEALGVTDEQTLEGWAEKRFPGLVENIGMSFFHSIVDNRRVIQQLLACRWGVVDLTSSEKLLLSDHPCIYAMGLRDPNFLMVLPISPARAFVLARSNEMADRISSAPALARRINESSVNQATTRVYGVDKALVPFLTDCHTQRKKAS